jgi:hypothetical protein
MEVKAPKRKDTAVKVPRAISHPVPQETKTKMRTEKQATNSVLGLEETFGAFVDGFIDFEQTSRLFRMVVLGIERLCFARRGARLNGDARDDVELAVRPGDAHEGRQEDDARGRDLRWCYNFAFAFAVRNKKR